jgi:hypothetical protein
MVDGNGALEPRGSGKAAQDSCDSYLCLSCNEKMLASGLRQKR